AYCHNIIPYFIGNELGLTGAIMKAKWLSDARKIADEVMNYLRRIAVRAMEEKHYSPEVIADIFGISRSSIYEWLRWYRAGGEAALATRTAPGAPVVITPIMDWWLEQTVLNSTPLNHGDNTLLWTRAILAELLKKHFGVCVSESTVGLHLHRLDLSCQTPGYRATAQDQAKVAAFLASKFPKIQRLAQRMGADIGFQDEAGVGVRTRSGRTWGAVGQPPKVRVSDQRGGYNVLSIITALGDLQYALEEKNMNGERYVEFLQQILSTHPRPLIILADQASFHKATVVREFVRAHRTQLRLFFFPPIHQN
ncbi:MAG TPA: IS630 family transposase, partial [Saprospiraceae bacterium]|nr:IS630 family transposase [Saprospiraceae bacterium]